jgi:hypothetical protein
MWNPFTRYRTGGRRIFVLSVQGDTLQVCTNPAEGHTFSGVISATLTG